jgi:octaprenyl-diphosphate synthase
VAAPEVAEVLAAAGPRAVELLVASEARLAEVVSTAEGSIAPHVASALSDGGKRLRPLLAVLSAGTDPADSEAVVRAAASVEMVHAATLVHDDILDRSPLRRGRPTVVAEQGRPMAVAVGDWLFAAAFGELVENGLEAVGILAEAGSDLARGELLQRADAWSLNVSEERFLTRCRLKTARLFQAAAELGALAGGIDPAPCSRFAERIGVAFQLLDDVLDITGPPERTGKPRGADLLDGTVTLPLILASAADPSIAAVDLRRLDTEAAAALCDRIEASGALDEVRRRAAAMVDQGIAEITKVDGVSNEAFVLVARAMVERVS